MATYLLRSFIFLNDQVVVLEPDLAVAGPVGESTSEGLGQAHERRALLDKLCQRQSVL